jgi:hypothetical protein
MTTSCENVITAEQTILSDDVKECKNCGVELPKGSEKRESDKGKSRKPIIIILIAVILISSVSAYYFLGNRSEDVEEPQILLDNVIIDEIEPDWLDNSSWQVSATAHFKILNSNDFDLDIIRMDYSIFAEEADGTFRIYDGTSSGGIISAKGSIQLDETFWFLSSTEGAENLRNEKLQFTAQGIAEFQTRTPSSTQVIVQFDLSD